MAVDAPFESGEMIFKSVRVLGFRSIEDSGVLPLGPVTLIVGRNNSGKSSLARAISLLQQGSRVSREDIRLGHSVATVELELDRFPPELRDGGGREIRLRAPGKIMFDANQNGLHNLRASVGGDNEILVRPPVNAEPYNLIYPILSERRHRTLSQPVTQRSAREIRPDDSNLVARVMTLAHSDIPEANEFRRLCREVLGIQLDVLTTDEGQTLGSQVDRFSEIFLDHMGAGLASALNLIVSMSGAKGKLLIVEEPETELHPAALKALLAAVKESAKTNQFIVTTHSNIVLTQLGALPDAKVIRTRSSDSTPPVSSYEAVDTTDARIEVLQELGYELADLELADGWLMFEESSAERVVRQYLIPWFAPGLLRLRTLAANGVSRVVPLANDFKEMFLFAHLEPLYRHRAWVITDGDSEGKAAVAQLRKSFQSWPSEHFETWDKPAFEWYYPDRFQGEVTEVLRIEDKQRRRSAKQELLIKVLNWIEEDGDLARQEFQESASGAIDILRRIEDSVLKRAL